MTNAKQDKLIDNGDGFFTDLLMLGISQLRKKGSNIVVNQGDRKAKKV